MNPPNEPVAVIESMRFAFPADVPGSLEAFAAIVAPLFELEPLAPHTPFFGEAEVYFLPDVVLSRGNCSGARYRRSVEMLRHSEADGVLVVAYRGGPVRFEIEGEPETIAPGEIVFFDLRRPATIVAPNPENISLIVSRRRLEALVPSLDATAHGFVLRGGANRALLWAHLQSLHAVAGSVTAEQAPTIGDATIQLVAGCLRESSRQAPPPGVRAVTLAEIKDAIEGRLGEPEFGPQSLIQELGISRATLYRLFEPLGGVKAYILERRLLNALRVISTPSPGRPRIKELSYGLGFSHPSAFSRAFRTRFGVSPSAVQQRAASTDGVDDKPWRLAPDAEPFLDPEG